MRSPLRGALAALLVVAIACAPDTPAGAQDADDFEEVASGFDFVTNLAYAPDGRLFVTEKESGQVLIVRSGGGEPSEFAVVDVYGGAERGLLGIALHPQFPDEPWVYLYVSSASDELNRVIRIRAEGDRGTQTETVIDLLPASAGYHNGGDIAFGPDGMLYVVTGEAHNPELAQAPESLGGKVLRLEPDGSIPADNPFGPGSPVYSLGHRNSFGLCIDPSNGQVWETENGPDSHDEVNRVEPGANYGWPEVRGIAGDSRFVDAVIEYPDVIAITGCAVAEGRLWWTDFLQAGLHSAPITGDGLGEERVVSMRSSMADVLAAPDGYLYVALGNRIERTRIGEGTPPPSPSPAETESPGTPQPSAESPRPAGGEGGGSNVVATVVVAVLLGLGIVVMRSRIRPPEEPPDLTAGP